MEQQEPKITRYQEGYQEGDLILNILSIANRAGVHTLQWTGGIPPSCSRLVT